MNRIRVCAVCAALWLLATFCVFAPKIAFAINPQFECSIAPDVNKSKCTAVIKTPWRYVIQPSGSVQQLGPYSSESAAIAAAAAVTWPLWQNSGWCSMTFNHVQRDVYPIHYDVGIDVVHGDQVIYDIVGNSNNTPPCASHVQGSGAELSRNRNVTCPTGIPGEVGWSLIYEFGNPATPYCACPWGSVCKIPCCTSNPTKGNPVETMTATKVETELDYQAAGTFPLRFQRVYRSNVAYKEYFGSGGRSDFAPLGIGWRATYFQRLEMVSSGSQATVVARRPNGVNQVFRLVGGAYIADADQLDRIVPTVDSGGNVTGWQYVTAADETESYDVAGRLLSVASRGGVVHTVTYASSADVNPASVTDSYGHQLTFSYTTGTLNPKLSTITLPDSTQIAFTYDAQENVATVSYPNATSRTYLYGLTDAQSVNLLTGITDENNVQYATFTYNGGRAASTKHAGNVDSYTFTYSSNNPTVVDPLGTSRTYTTTAVATARRYAASTAVCPGCGESKSVAYDAIGNVSSRANFNNIQTIFAYESARPLEISRTEAYGTSKARTITTSWNSSFHLPALITEPNRTTAFTYDTSGNLLSKTIADTATSATRTWTYTYDAYGHVLTEDGPRTDVSDVTTYTYYSCSTGFECGQVHTVTNALGLVTTYNTYNAHGQPLTSTDPNGVTTTLAYDARQRMTSRQIGTETTTFTYWPVGLLKKVTLPDGSFLQYTYDNAHRLTKIEDGDGNRIEYTLDAIGNRTAENAYDPSNALVRTYSRVFNTLNELWKQVGSAGTAAVTTLFGYDSEGNQTSINAPLTRNTANQFDELNRLKQITNPESGVTQFGYDATNNLTSVIDPRSLTTSYTYNGLGDLTQQVSPDTGTTSSTYNSAGDLATRTDARSKTGTYSYDALNRITSIAYPDLTTSFIYDSGTNGAGRLSGASDPNHSLTFAYDAQGRVTAKSQTVGTVTKSVSYAYTNGNLTSLVTPSGQTVGYGYSQGRITSVTLNGSTTILSQVLYEPFGSVRGWNWGNSSLEARVSDLDGKPTDLESAGSYTLAYDNAFRITGITDNVNSSKSWTYGYDALDRLSSAAKSGQTIGYTYDANSNRLTQSGTATASYTISGVSNRVSSITGSPARTYSYDAAGATTADGTNSYTYTDAGRLSTVTRSSVTTAYVYNALGQRVKKANASVTRYFVYDEGGHLLGEYDGGGALIEETIWMNDIPVATLRPNGGGVSVYYVHTDHLDTPRRITRPSDDVVVWRWDSDPFGTDAANEDPDGDSTALVYNLRFPGQHYDVESGTAYNYFRDYDPGTGRYVESDPIGLGGGVNTYAYVAGNPVSRIDPQGLQIAIPWVEPLVRPLPLPTTIDPAVPVPYPGVDVSTPGDPNGCDPCKGLREQLEAHEKKLSDYINDPFHSDMMSRGHLWMDMLFRNGANVEAIMQGRIRSLKKQIETFKQQYYDCMSKHGGGMA